MTALEHLPDGVLSSCEIGSPAATGQNQSLAVIDKRTAANRRNALKSTGPRTKAGKSAVARNSFGHGIYAVCPVIKPVESTREWSRHHSEMLVSIAPFGALETTFAERIILNGWRLRRAARYETDRMRSNQEGAIELWAFAIVALLFNPVVPVHLKRDTWTFIDFGVAVFLLVSVVFTDRDSSQP